MEKLYKDSNGEQVRYELKKLLLVLSYLEDHDQEKEFPNQKFVQNLGYLCNALLKCKLLLTFKLQACVNKKQSLNWY